MRFESIRLFAERAADAAPGFRLTDENAPHVAEVCFRLDGMPLAIELAAARAGVLTPAQTAARLRDSLDLLGGGRGRLTRQQTLAATLDWSHDLLTEQERVLFRRTGVFAGSFGLDAVEGVCGGDGLEPGETLELLGRLVDKSLIAAEEERGEYRYRLLETIRQYARERLADGRRDRAVWRLATARGTWPWPRPPTRGWPASASSSRRSSSSTTCARRWPRGCATTPDARCAPRWRCGSCGCGVGTSPRARGCWTRRSRRILRRRRCERAGWWPHPRSTCGSRDRSASSPWPRRRARSTPRSATRAPSRRALLYRGVLESARTLHAAARDTLEQAFAEAERVGDALVAAESRHAQGVEAHCLRARRRGAAADAAGAGPASRPTGLRCHGVGHDHRPRDRPRRARASAHVLRGHPRPVPRGRRRGGAGVHAVRPRARRADAGRLRRRARGPGPRARAAARARRPARHRGRAQRPRKPGALTRAVRARPRMAGGGAHDPPRHGRPARHRDDPGVPGPARRARRAAGRGAPADRASAGHLRRDRGRAGPARNAPRTWATSSSRRARSTAPCRSSRRRSGCFAAR